MFPVPARPPCTSLYVTLVMLRNWFGVLPHTMQLSTVADDW